ncbi:MAG: MFS transporter, partial [Chromatiales bacterium]|nr:MFS transporter [Chromatiales bacterium]
MTASSPGLYYGWYVVAAAFSVMLLGFGCAYSFSAFFPELSREFEASRASISLIFSIGGALYFGLGAVSGPLSDRYGPRWICVFGLVTLGLGLIFAALSDDLFGVYLGFGVGIGVGIGFSYVPSIGAVQPWFTERRGFASGLAVSGIGVGTFVGPLIASVLIAMFDWRTALIVLGLTALTLGSVAALFLDNDPVARGVREPGTSANASLDDASFTLREAIRARPFWLLFTASGCLSFAIFVPFVHLVPYALDHGLTATAGAALIGLVGVG